MSLIYKTTFVLMGIVLIALEAYADAGLELEQKIRAQLEKSYPKSEISLGAGVRVSRGELPSTIQAISILKDAGNGQAVMLVQGETRAEVVVDFSALSPAWIANRRIFPGERLKSDAFSIKPINVAVGMAREMRGLLLEQNAKLEDLEARQTILEGQFATTAAVQKVPDIKRGDAVKVRVVSGDVILSTSAHADEPSYVNQPIRVTVLKGKRQFTGKLLKDGTVEVRL